MSYLDWQGSSDDRCHPRRAPTPPPRDAANINCVVQSHVLSAQELGVAGEANLFGEEVSGANLLSREMNWNNIQSSVRLKGKRRHGGVDQKSQDSDSSSSSPASSRDARFKNSRSGPGMDEISRQRVSSPLRAVVTPTTVDRNRCSTYDNVDNPSSDLQSSYLGKPPPVSCPSRQQIRAITRNSPVQVDHLSPSVSSISRRHASPVTFPRHCQYQEGYCSPVVHHQSPSNVRSRTTSPSCAKYANTSGRSTPITRQRAMCDDESRSHDSWRDSGVHQDNFRDSSSSVHQDNFDGESTDSDHIRRRPSSSCGKAVRSHRGSLPPLDDCHVYTGSWQHSGGCYACSPNARRCHHWYGTVPQATTSCCAGYALRATAAQGYDHEDFEQRIFQLESEKDHLLLQVSVLTEQIEAQNEKIQELEGTLKEKSQQFNHSEETLRKELRSRSSLEKSKAELTTQISVLKIKLAATEHDREELEEKTSKLEDELVVTCACLAEKEADLVTVKSKSARNGTVKPLSGPDGEIHKLKMALSSVIAANDEKDKKIQELKTSLNRYRKLQELVLSEHAKPDGTNVYSNGPFVDSSLDLIAESDGLSDSYADGRTLSKPPPAPRPNMQPYASSSPIHENHHGLSLRETQSLRCSPILKCSYSSLPSNSSLLSQRARSSDNVNPPSKTPPMKRHYGTIPRQHGTDVLLQIHQQLQQHRLETSHDTSSLGKCAKNSPNRTAQSSQNLHHPGLDTFRQSRLKSPGFFGKGFFRLRSGKRSCSAPELALHAVDTSVEVPATVHATLTHVRRSSSPMKTVNEKEKPKGIKRIFGRLRRTDSENLNTNTAEFKRGGIRATAGPRLGWGQDGKKFNNMDIPFAHWNCSMIMDWLQSLGLGMYNNECRKWVKSGDQLLKAKSSDFEKELGMKNPIHRKKLLLAINGAKGSDVESFQKIDFHWIIRWLDDIGLPQYKDAFFDARVDGSVLHHLTVEDLFNLKVTNQLHHISLRRGIQVLRENDFNPQCLKRRYITGDSQTPSEVSKWTNHRVMEWLRTVDLSEYAPNLRGSGVHGGLMVYEPRFNADLLATLLNIPPNKTLLRRHLSTQFKQLVGSDLMQKKREWEAQPSYSPLSPSAKVKVIRRGQLSLIRKRNKAESEFEDYVCPMVLNKPFSSVSPLFKQDDKSTQVEQEQSQRFLMKEGKTIPSTLEEEANEAVNVLNELLKDEKVFENLASTNV